MEIRLTQVLLDGVQVRRGLLLLRVVRKLLLGDARRERRRRRAPRRGGGRRGRSGRCRARRGRRRGTCRGGSGRCRRGRRTRRGGTGQCGAHRRRGRRTGRDRGQGRNLLDQLEYLVLTPSPHPSTTYDMPSERVAPSTAAFIPSSQKTRGPQKVSDDLWGTAARHSSRSARYRADEPRASVTYPPLAWNASTICAADIVGVTFTSPFIPSSQKTRGT
ncbi:hypothetical protein F0U63_09095 [Cystobacter fuscus]|nr:hypothetical protein F0U63_09095 [Cystobacter fuscus]